MPSMILKQRHWEVVVVVAVGRLHWYFARRYISHLQDSRLCDIRESDDVFEGLMDFLSKVFELTADTKAIVVIHEIDAVPSSLSTEKVVQAQPLGCSSSVSLFGLLCPHVTKRVVPA